MKPGNLYKCPEWTLLLFPTRKAARATATATAGAWWSNYLGCRVTYIPAGELFMILALPDGEPDNYGYHQIQVLHGESVGWINWDPSWMKLEKVIV